jgi:hypothetical protein
MFLMIILNVKNFSFILILKILVICYCALALINLKLFQLM